MPADTLYRDLILEHNRAPRRFGTLEGSTHAAQGANPGCGDSLRCELIVREGRIADYRFRGESCAIATATASLLGEQLAAMDAPALARLRAAFVRRLSVQAPDTDDPALGDLNALSALRHYPARMRCAELPFATVLAALQGADAASSA